MPAALRLLLVEDNESDAALALHYLQRHGFDVAATRVEGAADFSAALNAGPWDAVLADYALPGFSAPEALRLLHLSGHDLPFIILSGVIDEERAVVSLRAGAHDFVTKANLARLGPALERELRAAQDRQARRAAEAAQRQQAAGFQLLFHDNPLPMWVYDPDSLRFLEVNPAAAAHYGYTRAEWLRLTLRDIRPAEDQDRLTENLRRARARPDRSGPWRHIKKNGEIILVEIVANDTRFAGRPARLVLARDITERVRAEAALRESEDRFRDLVENSRDLICTHALDGRILTVNPWAAHSLGYAREAVEGRNLREFLVPESAAQLPGYLRAVQRRGAVQAVIQVRTAAGEVRLWEFHSTLRTEGVAAPIVRGMAHDVTERMRAEAALWESEHKYRTLVETAEDVILMSDLDGRQLYRNPAFYTSQGLDPQAPVAEDIYDRIHPDDVPQLRAALGQIRAEGTFTYEYRLRHTRGHWMNRLARSTLLRDEAGQPTGFITVIRDITGRKQAEAQVQRQLRFLTALREIDRAISGSLDPRLSLTLLLTHTTAELGVDAGAVWVFRPETQTLERLVERGLRPRPPHLSTQRLGEGPVGRAALERRPLFLADLNAPEAQSRLVEAALAEGFASLHALPLIAKGEVRGVLEVYQRPPAPGAPPRPSEPEWHDFLHALAGEAAIALDNAQLFAGLQRANMDLTAAFDRLLESLARALDQRGGEPEGHSRRVADLAEALGRALSLSGADLSHARHGALLHDLGKLSVPETILFKPGPLTEAEWQVVRAAPAVARDLLWLVAPLRPAVAAVLSQHEHWDGSGYPDGLKGEQIPLLGRLCAAASAYAALQAERPYRAALTAGQARAHMQAGAGQQFDPRVVKALLELRA